MRSFSPGILWSLRGCFLLHPDCVCVGGVRVCVCVCACACACGPDVSLINENKIFSENGHGLVLGFCRGNLRPSRRRGRGAVTVAGSELCEF